MAESLGTKLAYFRDNPVEYVKWAFHAEPDEWQREALARLPGMSTPKISMQACAGPGKSALLAWTAWYFLSLYANSNRHPKGAAVSITQENLRDNLWAEIVRWQNESKFLKDNFTVNADKVFENHNPKTWFLSARSFPKGADQKKLGETLSGLHAEYVLMLVDESGGIPPAVMRAAEQSLSGPKWGKILQAGNPMSVEGCLYEASMGGGWYVIRITGDPDDPKRSPRVDIEWAREQIRKYGRENSWVKAYILGKFPKTAFNQLIGPDEVRLALGRHLDAHIWKWAQKRIGIDVAAFGDDRTVLFPRQGRAAFPCVVMREATTNEIAGRYFFAKNKFKSELDTVDDTGGWGGGVKDFAALSGNPLIGVHSSGRADEDRYFNKRAEMWFRMTDWIKAGGALPPDEDLVGEISSPTYFLSNTGKVQIESKDQIKKRLGKSPDKADALALTFAFPEQPMGLVGAGMGSGQAGRMVAARVNDDSPLERGDDGLDITSDRTHDFGYEV